MPATKKTEAPKVEEDKPYVSPGLAKALAGEQVVFPIPQEEQWAEPTDSE